MNIKVFTLVIALASLELNKAEKLAEFYKFDDYLNALECLVEPSVKLRVLQAVWTEILVNYPKDLSKVNTLYQQVVQVSNINASKTDKEQLAVEIRRYIVEKNAVLLADALSGNSFANSEEEKEFWTELMVNYEAEIVRHIYAQAIDEVYNYQPADVLTNYLYQIIRSNNSQSLAIMLEAQLHLYWKFVNRRDVNDLYLFNVAYYFHQIQVNSFYADLEESAQLRLNKAIATLPSSLQYLHFEPTFCLLNKAYSEYIYTTEGIDIDDERRYDFTWSVARYVKGNGRWVQNSTELSSDANGRQLNLKFALQSVQEHLYMYLERDVESLMNLILAWRSGSAPETSSWSLQLVDNQLVFSQNGLIMCASEKIFSTNRRIVYGYNDQTYTAKTEACQWIAEACPENY